MRWGGGDGAVLCRFGGTTAVKQAEAAVRTIEESGIEGKVIEDDDAAWDRQRDGQRSAEWAVVRVSSTQTGTRRVLDLADAPRRDGWWAAHRWGSSGSCSRTARPRRPRRRWPSCARSSLPPPCVLLDAPAELRGHVEPWGPVDPAVAELSRRVKERFDPAGRCNPGVFVGGI